MMRSSKRNIVIAAVCVVGLFVSGVFAQPAEGEDDQLKAEVVSVTGIVKSKQANDEKSTWEPVKVGQKLDRYSVVRTGTGSQAVLHFADRGKVVIQSGTKIGISQFDSAGGKDGKVTVKLGLKYGSMSLKVDKTRGANDFAVSTAVATLSVRGTEGDMSFWGDLGLFLFGEEGTFQVVKDKRRRFVGAGQRTSGNLARSTDMKNQDRDTQMGDTSGGLTKTEKRNLYHFGGGRGVFGFTGNPFGGPTRFAAPNAPCSERSHPDQPIYDGPGYEMGY